MQPQYVYPRIDPQQFPQYALVQGNPKQVKEHTDSLREKYKEIADQILGSESFLQSSAPRQATEPKKPFDWTPVLNIFSRAANVFNGMHVNIDQSKYVSMGLGSRYEDNSVTNNNVGNDNNSCNREDSRTESTGLKKRNVNNRGGRKVSEASSDSEDGVEASDKKKKEEKTSLAVIIIAALGSLYSMFQIVKSTALLMNVNDSQAKIEELQGGLIRRYWCEEFRSDNGEAAMRAIDAAGLSAHQLLEKKKSDHNKNIAFYSTMLASIGLGMAGKLKLIPSMKKGMKKAGIILSTTAICLKVLKGVWDKYRTWESETAKDIRKQLEIYDSKITLAMGLQPSAPPQAHSQQRPQYRPGASSQQHLNRQQWQQFQSTVPPQQQWTQGRQAFPASAPPQEHLQQDYRQPSDPLQYWSQQGPGQQNAVRPPAYNPSCFSNQ